MFCIKEDKQASKAPSTLLLVSWVSFRLPPSV